MAIYVMRRSDDGAFKVGYSDRVKQRLQEQARSGVDRIIGCWKEIEKLEKQAQLWPLAPAGVLVREPEWFESAC